MKIYAITKGNYLDYHICALTTSESKAEQLQNIYSDENSYAAIEVYEDYENQDLCIFWYCDANGLNPKIYTYHEKERVRDTYDGEVLGVYVYAKDKECAINKAQEMLKKYYRKVRKAKITFLINEHKI